MPKVRLLVPATYQDKPQAAGAELDVDDATFREWRMRGYAASIDDEQAQAKAAAEEGGVYTSYTGRPEAEGTPREAKPAPAPRAAKEADDKK